MKILVIYIFGILTIKRKQKEKCYEATSTICFVFEQRKLVGFQFDCGLCMTTKHFNSFTLSVLSKALNLAATTSYMLKSFTHANYDKT